VNTAISLEIGELADADDDAEIEKGVAASGPNPSCPNALAKDADASAPLTAAATTTQAPIVLMNFMSHLRSAGQ
jgi:hypothetical protein